MDSRHSTRTVAVLLYCVSIFEVLVIENLYAEECSEQEKLLEVEQWSETKFFEHGSPLITDKDQKYLIDKGDHLDFVPRYSVLKNRLEKQGHEFIIVDNLTEVIFHFYGRDHPEAKNYKIDISDTIKIRKCQNSEDCQDLAFCDTGVIQNDLRKTLAEQVVYLSWRDYKGEVIIYVQHKLKLVKCRESSGDIELQKLVMKSSYKQRVHYNSNILKYNNNGKNRGSLVNNFTICPNKLLYLQAWNCYYCKMVLELSCDHGVNETKQIPSDKSSIVVYSNNRQGNAWEYVEWYITGNNCTLDFALEESNIGSQIIDQIWAVGLTIVNRNMSGLKSSTSTSREPSTSTSTQVSTVNLTSSSNFTSSVKSLSALNQCSICEESDPADPFFSGFVAVTIFCVLELLAIICLFRKLMRNQKNEHNEIIRMRQLEKKCDEEASVHLTCT